MTENGQGFAPRGPIEIAEFLDHKAQELAQLQALIQRAHEDAEEAEIRWVAHFDQVMTALEAEGDKLPGEDKCVGLARRKGGQDLWAEWRRAERAVKRHEKTATLIDNQISACQSEAKLLRAVEA